VTGDQLMNLEDFHQLLGLSNTDRELIDAIAEHGGNVADLSPEDIRELGTDHLNLSQKGLSLAFQSRVRFEMSRGTPRGEGPFVFGGMFYYPDGGTDLSPYEGPAPFASEGVRNRADALRVYGEPSRTEEDDGEIDWDQWSRDGRQVRASYREDLVIDTVSVSVPMMKR
jgi:hypothetical protein